MEKREVLNDLPDATDSREKELDQQPKLNRKNFKKVDSKLLSN